VFYDVFKDLPLMGIEPDIVGDPVFDPAAARRYISVLYKGHDQCPIAAHPVHIHCMIPFVVFNGLIITQFFSTEQNF
jgi:hypothetical protein